MNNILTCSSCASYNQLPNGRHSMFCAYCGSLIEKPRNIAMVNSNLIVKPRIIGGQLTIVNRGISSLNEVINWFADNELATISDLDLSHNQISDLNGIERFINLESLNLSHNQIEKVCQLGHFNDLTRIDLSNNKIRQIDGLFTISQYPTKPIIIDLSGNDVISFSPNALQDLRYLLVIGAYGVELKLGEKPKSKEISNIFQSVCKPLTVNETVLSNSFWFKHLSKDLIDSFGIERYQRLPRKFFLEKLGKFEKSYQTQPQFHTWLRVFYDFEDPIVFEVIFPQIEDLKKALQLKTGYDPNAIKPSYCFIATAALGSYDHPEVVELRKFRDEWILKKKTGEIYL